MKNILGLLALLILGFKVALSQTLPLGGPTLPGIVKTAETTKTNVFEIKLKGISNSDQSRVLDASLLSKQGIISAVTNPATHVCRVEVLKKVTEYNLQEVIVRAGYEIAKTFND